ncbi:MAG: hypothetical protein IPL33_01280 [Sphingobacteriales bacterium]|nr:hypothetical protein [Sphingobacteriales bacterium]
MPNVLASLPILKAFGIEKVESSGSTTTEYEGETSFSGNLRLFDKIILPCAWESRAKQPKIYVFPTPYLPTTMLYAKA